MIHEYVTLFLVLFGAVLLAIVYFDYKRKVRLIEERFVAEEHYDLGYSMYLSALLLYGGIGIIGLSTRSLDVYYLDYIGILVLSTGLVSSILVLRSSRDMAKHLLRHRYARNELDHEEYKLRLGNLEAESGDDVELSLEDVK